MAKANDFIPMEENWDDDKPSMGNFALSVTNANKYDKTYLTLDMKKLSEDLEYERKVRRSIGILQARIVKLQEQLL